MISKNNLNWKIGGEAGFGIKSAGMILAKIFMKAGYEVFDYTEYPSLIRGGHNTFQLTIDIKETNSVNARIDVLVALNQETIDLHHNELVDGGVIIYDQDKITIKAKKYNPNINFIPLPLTTIAKLAGGDIMRNVVALGATLALVGQDLTIANQVVKENFKGKGKELVSSNLKALALGFKELQNVYRQQFYCQLVSYKVNTNILISANEATALGALAAGLNFYAGYPMTPSSSILHYLAQVAEETGVVVKHAEDEISVINMALGASVVGARSMVATSGGGFSLMVEALGLAGITETPLVIVNSQRPGPATGLPTWTEQGDLQFVLRAAQGDFPRIILAPADSIEAFYLAAEALNLADIYQLPVIILLDKFISEGDSTVPRFNVKKIKIYRGRLLDLAQLKKIKNYQRYRLTADGISPRTIPGMPGGLFNANSDEHDSYGYTDESSANRKSQVDKRQQKLNTFAAKMPLPIIYGNPKAKKTVVFWGSTKGPILDAYHQLSSKQQSKIRIMQLQYIWPFPRDFVGNILRSSKQILLVENNSNAQLGQLIAQETGMIIKNKLLKYDGRPFFREELVVALSKI